jgi:hypothetical protein
MKSGLLPYSTALYTGEARTAIKAPLALAKNSLKEAAVKMEIAITAEKDDPATDRFSIRWGKHELSAPVKFCFAAAEDTAAPKK